MDELVPNIIKNIQKTVESIEGDIKRSHIEKAIIDEIDNACLIIGEELLPGSTILQYKDALDNMKALIYKFLHKSYSERPGVPNTSNRHLEEFIDCFHNIEYYKNSTKAHPYISEKQWKKVAYSLNSTLMLFKFDGLLSVGKSIDDLYKFGKLLLVRHETAKEIIGPSQNIAQFLYKFNVPFALLDQERLYDLKMEQNKESIELYEKNAREEMEKSMQKLTEMKDSNGPNRVKLNDEEYKQLLRKLKTRTPEEADSTSSNYKDVEHLLNELRLEKEQEAQRIAEQAELKKKAQEAQRIVELKKAQEAPTTDLYDQIVANGLKRYKKYPMWLLLVLLLVAITVLVVLTNALFTLTLWKTERILPRAI